MPPVSNPWRVTLSRAIAIGLWLACGSGSAQLGSIAAAGDVGFARNVQPILAKYCVECHGNDVAEAKLKLLAEDGLLYGSASGRIVVPGNSAASLLLKVLAPGSKPHMPPEGLL